MYDTKIATCCYCGSRTVLTLTARDGHELACASCGAPVHEMKALKSRSSGPPRRSRDPGQRLDSPGPARQKAPNRKKKKRRKPTFWRVLEEVADVIEDIID